jgi:hypothetical protein
LAPAVREKRVGGRKVGVKALILLESWSFSGRCGRVKIKDLGRGWRGFLREIRLFSLELFGISLEFIWNSRVLRRADAMFG